jgi:hypothetical protein
LTVLALAGPQDLPDQRAPDAQIVASRYTQGYDPAKAQSDQIRTLPDTAWGKVVNGLQAGIIGPEKIRFNEVATYYLVLRNVTEKTIRVSLPRHPFVVSVRPNDSRVSHGVNFAGGPLQGWELKPGHQVNIPCPPVQFLVPGDLGLRHALTNLQPGAHTLYTRIGAGGEQWVTNADGRRHIFARPKDEWTGWLSPARHTFEVVAEKAPFTITPMKSLPKGHGLKYVLGSPPSLDRGRTEWIGLGDGLTFALQGSRDEHWLRDHGTYNRIVFWGPIPARRLKELNLLNRIRQLSRQYIENARHASQREHRVAVLVTCAKPLATIGLQFVPLVKIPRPNNRVPSDYLVRTIRDRRVELQDMGLAEPMREALEILTANDAPLPNDSQFKVVSERTLPVDLPDKAWGPENAGLRAAALMPDTIAHGATEKVRLFIRNVSDEDVRLAVSERAGYDYATAVDLDGNELGTIRPLVYPSGFGSVIVPEYNPGQSTQSPPTATLAKVLLKSGAVLELSTGTALSFHTRNTPTTSFFFGSGPEDGKPAVTHIKSKPALALVTWHLHTANGAIYSRDLKRRLWPARGSWSGLLRTAPVRVHLGP